MSWIDLEGAANVRDVGGLPTVDGRVTRSGVLLRADNLQDLTASDVQRLVGELGLRTVVDLRSTGEVHLTVPTPLDGRVRHVQLSLIPEWDGEPEREEVDRAVQDMTEEPAGPDVDVEVVPEVDVDAALPQLSDFDRRDRRDPADLTSHYVGYVEGAGANVGRALKVLADPDSGPTLVHCAAGKDRTGVVVALALAVAGVGHDEIVRDYAMTADVIDALVAKLAASPTYAEDMDRRDVASHTPRADTMDRVLTLLDERFGGPAGWLDAHGFGPEDRARLRSRLRD